MPTVALIDNSFVRADTPIAEDLQKSALEVGEIAGNITTDVLDLASLLAHDTINLNANREELCQMVVQLAALAGSLQREAKDLAAIRDKAAGTID